MKKLSLFLFVIASILVANTNNNETLQKGNKNFFIENKGQWPEEVKYLAQIGGMNAWITDFGVVYDYYKIFHNKSEENLRKITGFEMDRFQRENFSVKGHVVKSTFNNNNYSKQFIGENKQETYYNYFLGNDKNKWASYVSLYEGATIEELYRGIDIKYYFDEGLLRYDFIVKPGADISQITITLEGADNYSVNEKGELELETSLGKISHKNIVAYQKNSEGENEIVKTSFILKENKTIGFVVESYDLEKKLIIDPLVFSTFLGGNGYQEINGITLDDDGNAVVTGHTTSTDYPITLGTYDETHNGGDRDIFVTKLNPNGTELKYSTFIGGNDWDGGEDIEINKDGEVFIIGYTFSTNYPATEGVFDESYNGDADAIVAKLNSTGTDLEYSTFLGGNDTDYGNNIVIDKSNNVVAVTYTFSTDYPIKKGSYDIIHNGISDVCITKLDSTGTRLKYSTFLGGSNYDLVGDVAIDSAGNVYITGRTLSYNFPVTEGCFNEEPNGSHEAFVTKLNTTGTQLEYSTFLGGSDRDMCIGMVINDSGNAFVTGWTKSANYPVTNGAYDESFNGGDLDIFVSKLNSNGTALDYSTFIGGSGEEQGLGIVLDNNENVFVTGYTASADFPVTTIGAFDASYNGGDADAYVGKLNGSGTELEYSTFLGGNAFDIGKEIVIDNNKNIFITGYTYSTDYPVTIGAFEVSHSGIMCDGFVTKLNIGGAVGVENVSRELPSEFSLYQNYPNPFNPTTKIKYQLPKAAEVSLKVFDVLGNEIANLVNKKQPAGFYEVEFDASDLSSGVYLYKIISGHYVDVKKMIVLR